MSLSNQFQKALGTARAQENQQLRHSLESGDLSERSLNADAREVAASEGIREVIISAQEAYDIARACTEARVAGTEAADLREAAIFFNGRKMFSNESIAMFGHALESSFARVALPAPSVENLGDGVVGLEALEEDIAAVSAAHADLSAQSVDGVCRVFCSLAEAFPEIRDRLDAMKRSLGEVEYDESKMVQVDDAIVKALAVDGQIPSGLADYLETYSQFGAQVVGVYTENATETASKSPTLAEALENLGDESCPVEATFKAVEAIGDPRSLISPDQLNFRLPGSGPLFADSNCPSEDGASGEGAVFNLVERLKQFNSCNVPVEPCQFSDRHGLEDLEEVEVEAVGDAPAVSAGGGKIRVLSKASIEKGICGLIKLIDSCAIETFADSHRDAWTKARSGFFCFRKALSNITPSQAVAIRPVTGEVEQYFDTLFDLAVWPALNLMVNLACTANAFILLAERSISGEDAEVDADPIAPESAVEVDSAVALPGESDIDAAQVEGAEEGVVATAPSEQVEAPASGEGESGGPLTTAEAGPDAIPSENSGAVPIEPEPPVSEDGGSEGGSDDTLLAEDGEPESSEPPVPETAPESGEDDAAVGESAPDVTPTPPEEGEVIVPDDAGASDDDQEEDESNLIPEGGAEEEQEESEEGGE